MSNSPFISTGYGMTTANCCRHLQQMGHDVAIFAFFGFQGSVLDWGGIPIYPNNAQDWGTAHARMFFDHFKADVLITLVDIFTLEGMDKTIPWVAFSPIDHDPVNPRILSTIADGRGLIKILTESKFGRDALWKKGIESTYLPHATDCQLFAPRAEWRKEARGEKQWEDKFVIGTVATNHSERKNFNVMFKAVKVFSDRHPNEIAWYVHTDPQDKRGINLIALWDYLKLEGIAFFPPTTNMNVGIEPETLAKAYNSFDVFLLPSKGEGFGVPLIEAQACAVPIITTDCLAQTELMGGGWLIKDLIPVWDGASTWNYECKTEEVVARLEQAYQAKKDGSIENHRANARAKALEYDNAKIFTECWPPVLEDIEDRIKHPNKFKRFYSYEGYYKMRASQSRDEDKFIAERPEHPLNQVGIWHGKNREDINVKMVQDIFKGKKILDIGAGGLQEERFLARIDAKITKVDMVADEERGITQADIEYLPFERRIFDVVIAREIIEHVIDDKKAIKEMSRVLKNKGYLFITCPNLFNTGIDGEEHVRGFSPEDLLKFLDEAGFKIIDKRGNVPNIMFKVFWKLTPRPVDYLSEFQKMAEGFDENPLSYYIGSQMFVLAQKKK